ncbi:MAG: gamma-glutamyltransferase [Chloroflexota bacterium]|nr:gamma-glutamyltransferase [Chloroflexota bacterium]MDE2886211.1 gamma-glutamyltransferase [Chloroflexota bacterium]
MSSAINRSHSPVYTTRGLVGSASTPAGAVGAQVMREGGNAFDAAVAVAAAEAVTLPMMCGIGGEVFALLYHAASGTLHGVSSSGRAPMRATREYFTSRGYVKMPADGPLTPSVPGEVLAWQTIVDRFGTRSLASLIDPAIGLASEGFSLPPRSASYFSDHYDKIAKYESTAKTYIRPDGSPYLVGDVFAQPNLARSLRRIAQHGPDEFYRGALAREIAQAMEAGGGLIDEADLAAQETLVYDNPPSVRFHGHTVYATGLPSQGVLTLELLSLLDGFDLAAMGHNTIESIHTMVEAKRLAFADRLAYVGDPAFIDVPLDELLSPEYAAERIKRIDPERAAEGIVHAGELAHSVAPTPSTSYFNVVDREGNAVSFIHSLSAYWGSGFVAGDTGILLNDRAGRGFYLDEGHVNVIAPGKKTINTIHNYMVFKDDRPVLVGGTPGGDNQPQWNAQAVSNVIDHGMNVQEAADAPRWTHFPGTDPRSIDEEMVLRMEDGFPEETLRALEAKGHKIRTYPSVGTPGAVQLIGIDHERGVHTGGTDRRSDGYPIPE